MLDAYSHLLKSDARRRINAQKMAFSFWLVVFLYESKLKVCHQKLLLCVWMQCKHLCRDLALKLANHVGKRVSKSYTLSFACYNNNIRVICMWTCVLDIFEARFSWLNLALPRFNCTLYQSFVGGIIFIISHHCPRILQSTTWQSKWYLYIYVEMYNIIIKEKKESNWMSVSCMI